MTDAAAAVDFARANGHAVLAVLRRDGRPAMSPVVVGVVDDALVISSRETAYKVQALRREPRAWLCVLPDAFFGRWIHAEVDVQIVPLPEAMEPLKAYYRATVGEHPDWADYEQAMEREQRVLLRCTPIEIGPRVAG